MTAALKPKWHKFDPAKWRAKLPKEREWVLVTFPARWEPTFGLPRSYAIGYLRFSAGDRKSPFFVIPGIGGTPDAWAPLQGDFEELFQSAIKTLGRMRP